MIPLVFKQRARTIPKREPIIASTTIMDAATPPATVAELTLPILGSVTTANKDMEYEYMYIKLG